MTIKKLTRSIIKFYHFLSKNNYPNSLKLEGLKFDIIIHYLTWRCNSRCITCNCWQTSPTEQKKEVWNLDNIRKFYSTVKANYVYLTGGEPSIIPNFREIVEIIYKTSGASVSFTTNGLATKKIEEDLLWLKKRGIIFSLDLSCNGFEQKHDFSRGIIGNYQKILELINFCQSHKIYFTLSFTAFSFNLDEAIPFIDYWNKKGVEVTLGIARFDQRYKINENFKKDIIDDRDYPRILEKILKELCEKYPQYLPQYQLIKKINNNEKNFPCFGLVKRLVVGPYGEVFPCDGLVDKLYLGNLKESDFDFRKFIQSKEDRFKEVFNIIKEKRCQPCFYITDLLYGINLTLPKKDIIRILKKRFLVRIKKLFK